MFGGSIGAGEIYSAACAVLWAVAVIFFRMAGRQITPVALNLFKNTFGLLLFLVTLPLLGVSFFPAGVPAADWMVLLLSGIIGMGVADSLFFASLNRLGAIGSAVVDGLYSPSIMLCAFLYLNEPIGPGLLVALGLMFAALVLGSEPPKRGAIRTPEDRRQGRVGVLLGAAAMLLMAAAIVGAKPVLVRVDPWWATTVRLVGGELFLVLQGLLASNRAGVVACFRPGRHYRVLLPGAFIGAYLALILWIMGMKLAQTSVAGILNQLSAVFVIVLAVLFLGEPLRPRKAVAVALGIAAGVIAVL